MPYRRPRVGLLALFSCIVALSGSLACEEKHPCSDSLSDGDTVSVSVLRPWIDPDGGSLLDEGTDLPSCGLDDIAVGSTVTFKLRPGTMIMRLCYAHACPADFPTPGKSGVGGPIAFRDYVCLGDTQVALGENCEGWRRVAVYRQNPHLDAFAEPQEGVDPPMILTRQLVADRGRPDVVTCEEPAQSLPVGVEVGADARACSDSWVVQLRRVP